MQRCIKLFLLLQQQVEGGHAHKDIGPPGAGNRRNIAVFSQGHGRTVENPVAKGEHHANPQIRGSSTLPGVPGTKWNPQQ